MPAAAQISPVTVLGYDELDNLVYRENPDDTVATWTYNSNWNVPATATDELSRTTAFSYDTSGNLTSVTDPASQTTAYAYNTQGLPTGITLPDPDGTGPLAAAVTTLAYDSYGRLATRTNPDNSTRTYTYNTADQILSETDELTHAASFTYDTLDRLTSRTDRTGADHLRIQCGRSADRNDRPAHARDRLPVQRA